MKVKVEVQVSDERLMKFEVVSGQEYSFDLMEFVGMPEEFKRQIEQMRVLFIQKVNSGIDEIKDELLDRIIDGII